MKKALLSLSLFCLLSCSSSSAPLPPAPEAPTIPVGQIEPLSPSDSAALLEKLPDFSTTAETTSVELRDRSLPPPKAGSLTPITLSTEPLARPDVSIPDELAVLRVSPAGDVSFAKSISIVFNQAMVPLGETKPIEAPPVNVSPAVAGKWRWVGDRMLTFEADAERLPMSTDFTVEIPAGLSSNNGKTLTEKKVSTFSTPTPKLLRTYPDGQNEELSPLLILVFNQRVDVAKIQASIQIKAGAQKMVSRPASLPEMLAKKALSTVAALPAETFVALMLDKELPRNTSVEVILPPGSYSKEGERRSATAEQFSFKTYGPLSAELSCNEDLETKLCSLDSWYLQFSNILSDEVTESDFVITPSIKDYKVEIYDSSVYLQGRFQPDTQYQIKLRASLNDVFGQTLGKEQLLTRKTMPAPKSLSGPSRDVITLSSLQKPELTFYSSGYSSLRIKMYRVSPLDYRAIDDVTSTQYPPSEKAPIKIPGELLSESSVTVDLNAKDPKTIIDLAPTLQGGIGNVLVSVTPEAPILDGEIPPVFYRWVNVTNLGVDLFMDGGRMLAFASSLSDGKRLANVEVILYPDQVKATTDANGVAVLSLPPAKKLKPDEDPIEYFVSATSGKDIVLVHSSEWQSTKDPESDLDSLLWYVTDDRNLYKPGESVSFKGIIRRQPPGEKQDVLYIGDSVTEVKYELKDSLGNKITEGALPLSRTGTFSSKLPLPKTMNLGSASLRLWVEGSFVDKEHQHRFRVEEYRRPEFEVFASSPEGPFFLGKTAESTVTANYYTGGGLPEAPVVWEISASQTSYTPPDNADFTFGFSQWSSSDLPPPFAKQTIEGFTDALGKHTATIDLKTLYDPDYPMYFSAYASVTDVNQQEWSGYTGFTAHSGLLYVGLSSPTEKPEPNTKLPIEAVVVDIDGKRISGKEITIEAKRMVWTYKRRDWVEEPLNVGDCKVRSAVQAQTCTFQVTEGGNYTFTTTVTDDSGKKNKTELTVYVAGAVDPRETPELKIEPSEDGKEYKPGDVAKFFIQAPFSSIEGIALLGNGQIVKSMPLHFDKVYGTLEIPVEGWMMPRANISVFLIGFVQNKSADGALFPKKPIYAQADASLSVSTDERRLAVTTRAVKKVLKPTGESWKEIKSLPPGGKAEIEVTVKDFQEKPVKNAEVSIIVVDEAVLDIASFHHPSPEWSMYSSWRGYRRGYESLHSRDELLDEEEMLTREAIMPGAGFGLSGRGMGGGGSGSGYGAGAGRGDFGQDEGPFEVRKNLDPLALFAMDVKTNSKGMVRVPIKLPDSLTRYRIFAIAATEKSFGAGRGSITAKLPLMVRPSLPRFLRDGDTALVPVVVQNLSDDPVVTEVVLRGQNATVQELGFRMNIPAKDRLRVFFTVKTERPGVARFQAAARSISSKDAVELAIPVYTPTTTEDNAIYGQLDEGVLSSTLALPKDASEDFGGMTLQTSTTALSSLTDAALYLERYPYACSEQLSSRMMAYMALYDVLDAFAAEGLPSKEDLNLRLKKDLERLSARQNSDGGFGFWSNDDDHWPYISLHVIHALARAKARGLLTGEEKYFTQSLSYLDSFEKRLDSFHWYNPNTKNSLLVYSLYIKKLIGKPDAARAKRLLQEEKALLSLESMGRLLFVLSDDPASVTELKQMLLSRVIETSNEARFASEMTEEDERILLASSHRADAIILDGLLAATPDDPIIPKVVASLLSHRVAGRWKSTQENVFVLLALERYFKAFEAETPDFTLKTWVQDFYISSQEFHGRSTAKQQLFVAMHTLAGLDTPSLTLSKEGKGRLYYRLGLSYSPKETNISAADYGFIVERSFESLKDPSDVTKLPDGTWKIKSGATVRVRLSMASSSQRAHVALVDQLAGGLEVQNASLAIVPREGNDTSWDWWRKTWYEHQNLRDDRVEAFTTELAPGSYEYTYVVRATTPGTFLVPPTKAEEMYSPEVFGRSKSDVVIIDAPSEQL